MASIQPKPLQSSKASGLEGVINKIPKGTGALLFDKSNYILMALGVVLIAVGFILMAGGADPDPKVFNPDEVYSKTRTIIAPIVVLSGFVVEIFAVLKRPTEKA